VFFGEDILVEEPGIDVIFKKGKKGR